MFHSPCSAKNFECASFLSVPCRFVMARAIGNPSAESVVKMTGHDDSMISLANSLIFCGVSVAAIVLCNPTGKKCPVLYLLPYCPLFGKNVKSMFSPFLLQDVPPLYLR